MVDDEEPKRAYLTEDEEKNSHWAGETWTDAKEARDIGYNVEGRTQLVRVKAKIGTPTSDLAGLVADLGEAVHKLGRIVDMLLRDQPGYPQDPPSA
jgi:hypothetical protein